MKRQPQFESDSDRGRIVRLAVRDAAFQVVIWILSVLAIAGMAWITWNGEKVDTIIEHFLRR